MNIKKLGAATRIYESIKKLDAEIREIDKMAMLVANGDVKPSFELTIEDLSPTNEVESTPDDSVSNTNDPLVDFFLVWKGGFNP